MKKIMGLCFLVVGFFSTAQAGKFTCSKAASGYASQRAAAKSTLADAAEGDYDVKYLKFNLNLTDTSLFIQGDVSTTALVIAASMGSYVFELGNLLTIDSAKINGAVLPVTTSGFVRTIALPVALSSGSTFTAQIFYHGFAPSGSGFFNGLTHAVSGGGTHMVYNVSDPWVAMVWWPVKQSANDKIDSVDMYVSVPRGVVDGSNGLLVNVDTTSNPGYWNYHWQTHYPIDYYLISVAVAKYAEYKSYMHFTGSTDSMLIQNFFMDTATFNPAYKSRFDSVGMIVDYYSTLFGRYPFWKEKYGMCYTNLPGGMEHQTMTTIGVPVSTVIAHELMHQWFGDNVTYKTWGDMWLSEGFASFAEQIYLNHFWGAAASLARRQDHLANALTNACGMTYVNDTSSSDSLFNSTTVYSKGECIINMLRMLAPADTLFFNALKTYQAVHRYDNASTADLKGIVETFYGFPLDTFFNQWIYGRGYPQYKISWNQRGSTVFVKLMQSQSCPSYTPHFSTQLELQLHGATADTIVRVYNNIDTQVFSFDWSPAMSTVYLNPNAITLCKQIGAIAHDVTLSTGSILPKNFRILPNPAQNSWMIGDLSDDVALTLTDMSGRILWQGTSTAGPTTIPGAGLPSGNYVLNMQSAGAHESVQLVHW